MNKRVLITGGYGYLGGRIAESLVQAAGWKIRVGSRVKQLLPDVFQGCETVVMDVLDQQSSSVAMCDVKAVVHLAGMNENDCCTDPNRAVLVNSLGTLNLLQKAISCGVERFIYFSTAHVYGAHLIGTISEETLAKPLHPYAITHRAAEDFVLAEHAKKTIEGVVVRLSNGFGPPVNPGVDRWTLLVNDLCQQAVQHQKLVLRSSGLQQRDFITLTDVCGAVGHLLALSREGLGDGLFNLGGRTTLNIWEMAKRIAARCQIVLGFLPDIIRPEPDVEEGGPFLEYRIDKLTQTGFHPLGNIDREIDKMLRFCDTHFGTTH